MSNSLILLLILILIFFHYPYSFQITSIDKNKEENVIKRSHFIPNTFSHNETNPFSSIFSGNEAKSTCSN